jgi:hypothetical protein
VSYLYSFACAPSVYICDASIYIFALVHIYILIITIKRLLFIVINLERLTDLLLLRAVYLLYSHIFSACACRVEIINVIKRIKTTQAPK